MSRKLRYGVVGMGGIWTWGHAPDMLKHPEVEVVAVCDVIKEKADNWAKQTGAKAYYDYKDLIANADLDIVDISRPTSTTSLMWCKSAPSRSSCPSTAST